MKIVIIIIIFLKSRLYFTLHELFLFQF